MEALLRNWRVVRIGPDSGPAIARPIVAIAARAARRFSAAVERYRQNCALAALDDHLLKDIGLTRADVMRETAKSIWRDDATAENSGTSEIYR
jgi:uncharacterized protein YjiS (DUF1127 family)